VAKVVVELTSNRSVLSVFFSQSPDRGRTGALIPDVIPERMVADEGRCTEARQNLTAAATKKSKSRAELLTDIMVTIHSLPVIALGGLLDYRQCASIKEN